jgi:hypothetical protein
MGRLREAVLSGESGFVLEHGMGTYEYMAAHPELGLPFDRWMTHQSEQHNAAVVAGFDFSPFHVVADIGGGQGSTLAAILQAKLLSLALFTIGSLLAGLSWSIGALAVPHRVGRRNRHSGDRRRRGGALPSLPHSTGGLARSV